MEITVSIYSLPLHSMDFGLQLGSDLRIAATHAGFHQSRLALNFTGYLTVFVIVFAFLHKQYKAISAGLSRVGSDKYLISAAKTSHHVLYRVRIHAKQLQNHPCSPNTEPMKINQCKNQSNSKQNSGYKSSDISAFIGSQPL